MEYIGPLSFSIKGNKIINAFSHYEENFKFIRYINNTSNNFLFFWNIRLKGIACTDSNEGRSAPTRFRSNSVPIPKIEVTICGDESVNDSNKTNKVPNGINIDGGVPEICIEDGDDDVFGKSGRADLSASNSPDAVSPFHGRSISMREGLKKKRNSIFHASGFKNFKSIVESKILSKSNMALESEESESTSKQGLARKRTCEGRFHASVTNY